MRVSKGVVTKKNIEDAAAKLFSSQGFNRVTMREIAKEAGCSHTLIYMHYKDKEDLLRQMTCPLLEQLESMLSELALDPVLTPPDRLRLVSKEVIAFCLFQRSATMILFQSAVPVALTEEQEDCDKLRSRIFGRLREAVIGCLSADRMDSAQTLYRIYLFMLHGMIMSFLDPPGDPTEQLYRASRLIDRCVDILLGGPESWLPPSIQKSLPY
ncbi:TetR/AcrR family transcriptional regulator [Gorillibacterium sp. CAU 1737]|uniref:TetR/AcrR family transcriptional regulator n=1 Tax=Gorillibacterium sp. CAU 1737 TaxID=3140362 RepID=UPI0032601290